MMKQVDLLIIGAGAAGLAAALGAYESGIKNILIVEREKEYGGILQQCIHNGFGLQTFDEELSGPTYAEKYYNLIKDNDNISIIYESTVLDIKDKTATIQSPDGLFKINCQAIILASGSRERPAGAIGLKGDRPVGVFTAGTAQKYLNKQGFLVGKKVFILGSGDIGLIMARRITLEGGKVIGVAELMPYSNGLARNIKQCLQDFDIPLYLSHTVEAVHGKKRLEYITLVQVDENLNLLENTRRNIECDCLLLSIGLLPENSLLESLEIVMDPKTKGPVVDDTYMTCKEGIFACGNALHIHDLVDYVSLEAKKCGRACGEYILKGQKDSETIKNHIASGVSYVVPQAFHKGKDVEFSFRVNKVFKDCSIHIYGEGIDKTIRKVAIAPSQMQKVLLKAEELSDCQNELYWEVK